MEKSVKEKVPNVVALLAGLLGMVLMTVWCYIIDPDPQPREVAVKAGLAWGVMLIVGYIIGGVSTRFLPEPAPPKKPPGDDAPVAAGKVSIGAPGPVNALGEAAPLAPLDENHALNVLLNEPHGVGAPQQGGATAQAAPPNPPAGTA
jgi:hypothetical protein